MSYVIKRDRYNMLATVQISVFTGSFTQWTRTEGAALHFNKEEAEATIEFITNVIDSELGETLFWEEVE